LPDGRSVCAVPEPDDEVLTCDYWKRRTDLILTGGPHSALVSSWLGCPVRLARAPRGDVVYGAQATMIATASLADLADRAARPELIAEGARFRATFVIDTDIPFAEEAWQGREIILGATGLGEIGVRGGALVPSAA